MQGISPSLIRTNFAAANWEEAVREAGRLLLLNDCIEERFIEAMVEMVKKNGAYIVISKGLALPHARPEDGAKKIAVSVVKLSTPVPFGHPKNDPVDLVIALASIDSTSHLQLMASLAGTLSQKDKVERIRQAKNPQEIYEIFMEGGEER